MNFSHHDLTLYDRSYPLVSTTSGITLKSGLFEIVTFKVEDPYDIPGDLSMISFSSNTGVFRNDDVGWGGSNNTRLLLIDTLNCPNTGQTVFEIIAQNLKGGRGYSYFPVTITL